MRDQRTLLWCSLPPCIMVALCWSGCCFFCSAAAAVGAARHGARRSPLLIATRGGSRGAVRPLLSGAASPPPVSSRCLGSGTLETVLAAEGAGTGDLGGGGVRSPDLVEREYADLHLKEKLGHLGHVRIRQHVNPLSASLSVPSPVPNWKEVFRDSRLPLMVDIGCGSGRFLIWHAKKFPESKNYLGLEIRQKLVKRAQFWVEDLALRNIYFMLANATVSFEQLVATYPGPLLLVSILMCSKWHLT